MNDEMIEEFQSDSIDDLVHERKKDNAVQHFLAHTSSPTKYYHIENYANGDTLKSEILPEHLDKLGKGNKDSLSKQEHRCDSLFYATIPMVLHYEGGYVNDPLDKGGKTNYGITQKFLGAYKKKANVNVSNVKDLTKKDAIDLYKAEWNTRGFGLLDNTDVMKLVYDFAVNSGPQTAIVNLQKST